MSMPADNPGVIVPPPLIPLAALALGLLLDWLLPAYVLWLLLSFGTRMVLGGALVAAGVGLIVIAGDLFSRAKTNIPPW